MEIKFKEKLKIPVKEKESYKEDKQETLCIEVAELVTELMNASTSLHKLHLKVTGTGSFAQHSALQSYKDFNEFSDTLAEEFQGAYGEILKYKEVVPTTLNNVKEGLSFLDKLKSSITELQSKLPYSEIINQLDTFKSEINSIKYKLLFLS